MRMCANSGSALHLVEPLGFELDEPRVRRAGLDYRDMAVVRVHPDLQAARDALPGSRWWVTTARATRPHTEPVYQEGDAFLLGPEPAGLPEDIIDAFPEHERLRIPMVAGSRSLNLSNAAAVLVYEAWRQVGFAGAGDDLGG